MRPTFDHSRELKIEKTTNAGLLREKVSMMPECTGNPLQAENEARVSCRIVRMLGQEFYCVCYSVTVGASSHCVHNSIVSL